MLVSNVTFLALCSALTLGSLLWYFGLEVVRVRRALRRPSSQRGAPWRDQMVGHATAFVIVAIGITGVLRHLLR